jgi:hypothetical protein
MLIIAMDNLESKDVIIKGLGFLLKQVDLIDIGLFIHHYYFRTILGNLHERTIEEAVCALNLIVKVIDNMLPLDSATKASLMKSLHY